MQTAAHATIYFEPDGYVVTGDKIMGRQAAGNSFLRAAIAHAGAQPLSCFSPSERSAKVFSSLVNSINSSVKTQWYPTHRPDLLKNTGTLYIPGPNLDTYANQRLRVGPDAFSICGVTHTTASHGAMDAISAMLSAPVMPWDALICTSNAVKSTVDTILEAQMDLLRWRFGKNIEPVLPQLPVIPLGIQCDDFVFDDNDKKVARKALQIQDDEIAILYVGRLSYHAKAHPHAMMLALENVARETGKKLVLIQCGWFANDAIKQAYKSTPKAICPSVRCVFTDGKDTAARNASWAAADIFASLADNFQETFGITPIEAMAAGLPVVVSDWDGYKDTVPNGKAGFRIPTWTLVDDEVHRLAARHEARTDSYDRYSGYACQTIALDQASLTTSFRDLVNDPSLRQKMGNFGRTYARATFDWSVIYKQYQALWTELGSIRQQSADRYLPSNAPKAAPARMDPYKAFAAYPTHVVAMNTRITPLGNDLAMRYAEALKLQMFDYAKQVLPSAPSAGKLLRIIEGTPGLTVANLATKLKASPAKIAVVIVAFAKIGLITLSEA
ncbi:glycosyltransferase family 4 protein [Kordiimonas sp.]|uniref:glycosyltransferase family 4 protein n=1 Tax=Kordiimonas sp. TaxID=1970157 RepID=UPI003A8FB9DD